MSYCFKLALLLIISLTSLAAGARGGSRAVDTVCNGSLTGTIAGDIIVPAGGACTLYQAKVDGDVRVLPKASLLVDGREEWSTIAGDVEADNCASAFLEGSVTVGGNVPIRNCKGASGFSGPGVKIRGNFRCEDNQAACRATLGEVAGDVVIEKNRSTVAGEVSLSVIGGDLACKRNTPAPTHALGGEWVGGHLQGQCAANLGFAAAPYPCASLAGLALPDTTVSLAQTYAAGTVVTGTVTAPVSLCRVVGKIQPSTNPVGDSNINFEVWLPTENWTGRYEQAGNGGSAGSIRYVFDVGSLQAAAANNNAAASTDDGTSVPAGFYALGHPQKINDFGYRAVHRTALDSRVIVAAFYGTPPAYAYFKGCSNGGREGLMEAQRYPEDFDGIMVGAPPIFQIPVHAAFLWNAQHLNNPNNPAGFIPNSSLPAITNAVQGACANTKTVPTDNFLGDLTQCHFSTQSLWPTLTQQQIQSLDAVYNGPTTSAGVSVGPGYEPGNEAQLWLGNITETPVTTVITYLLQETPATWNPLVDFDVDTTPAIENTFPIVPPSPASAVQTVGSAFTTANPNLTAFRAHGGKLIHYHGWADPTHPSLNSVNYFNRVVAFEQQTRPNHRSALAETQEYYRLLMAPGMGHCRGGPGPSVFGENGGSGPASSDMFTALERWVEEDIAPAQVNATDAPGTFTRPLCPYPQNATYTGTGSTADAANFVCR
jgi:feruloyl esterase